MTIPSAFETLILLHSRSLLNTNIVTKMTGCTLTYVMKTEIGYTVRRIMKAWKSLVHTSGMRPSSKMVSPYLLFNFTPNILTLSVRKKACFASRLQSDYFAEDTGTVTEKEEVAANACEKSAAVNEVPLYLTYL